MGALILERLTWPEVEAEIRGGRDTIVIPFGSTEQHGPHLPLGTDAMLGDAIGEAVAARLDAFLAPTVRIGCSSHHLAFPGTLSVEEETFHRVVADVVRSITPQGFRRIVLLPTHGGNFAPLGAAVERIGPVPGVRIVTFSDVGLLAEVMLGLGAELGIPPSEGGIHAGEWETSMMLALRPELTRMERAEVGYTGDLMEGMQTMVARGTDAVAKNGVFGDPRRASAEAGRRYVDRIVDRVLQEIARA
jgi:mycofactocin system creatininase family protein